MAAETTEDVGNGRRMVLGVSSLLAIGVLFVVGLDLSINQAGLGNPSPVPVYAIGFFLGAWATATTTFVANYAGRKLFGDRCIRFGFPER